MHKFNDLILFKLIDFTTFGGKTDILLFFVGVKHLFFVNLYEREHK